MRGLQCLSVCLSVCASLFDFGEGAVFWVETYISSYILGDDLSPLNVALYKKKSKLFWRKSSAITAVIYAGTAQSLNGLARDLLAH